MIKVTVGVGKRQDWSRAEWLVHYREVHGPLVASVAGYTQYGRRYVQNPVLHDAELAKWPEYEIDRVAITEVYDDAEGMAAAMSNPQYLANIRPDELRFTGPVNRFAIMGREHLVHDGLDRSGDKAAARQPRLRALVFLTPAPRRDEADFQARWLADRADAVAGDDWRQVRRYLQTHRIQSLTPQAAQQPALVEEFWFDSRAQAMGFWAAERLKLREQAGLLDIERTFLVFAESHLVFSTVG